MEILENANIGTSLNDQKKIDQALNSEHYGEIAPNTIFEAEVFENIAQLFKPVKNAALIQGKFVLKNIEPNLENAEMKNCTKTMYKTMLG